MGEIEPDGAPFNHNNIELVPDKLSEQRVELSSVIKRARRRAFLTQEEVAEKLGIDARTIRRWESGSAMPTSYSRRKLLETLAISPEELGLLDDNEDNSRTAPTHKSEKSVESTTGVIPYDLRENKEMLKVRWFLVSTISVVFALSTILSLAFFIVLKDLYILVFPALIVPVIYRVVRYYFPLKRDSH